MFVHRTAQDRRTLPEPGGAYLSTFHPLTSSDIRKLRRLKISRIVDRITNALFICVWDMFLDVVTSIINSSLRSGVVPTYFKTAVLTPIIKNQSLDPQQLQSYRPVSNLPFLSNVLETAVAQQLQPQLDKYLGKYQSAYRVGHGVETALNHVYSSIYEELDRGNEVLVVLLDLSAAFDTIDHNLIIKTLQNTFYINGKILDWIKSYLENRHFQVKIGSHLSQHFPLNVGVPQGSILRPVLFNCVMAGLAHRLEEMRINHHIYADDTQFWIPFQRETEQAARDQIKYIFHQIGDFMQDNDLKLNPEKTVFLPVSRSREIFAPWSWAVRL